MTHLLIILFNKSIIFKTLVTEALMTCNKLKLKIIKMLFCDNSYPLDIVQSSINPKISFASQNIMALKKCPVCLRQQWISKTGARQISTSILQSYFSANPQVIFLSQSILKYIWEDSLPILKNMDIKLSYRPDSSTYWEIFSACSGIHQKRLSSKYFL